MTQYKYPDLDEFTRAKLIAEEKREKRKARLGIERDKVDEARDGLPVAMRKEPKRNTAKRGRVNVQVSIWLGEEPMVFEFDTNMRGALLTSQMNERYLRERFKALLKEFG